jgi:hypothetical protein
MGEVSMSNVVKTLLSSDSNYEVYEVYIDGVLSGTDTIYVGPERPTEPRRGGRSND